MKHTLLFVVFVTLFLQARAEDTQYRATLKSAHERYHVLDAERNDYRKAKPGLPADQEDEYRRVVGQLLLEDPVWALTQQIQADIDALLALRSRTPADNAALENLKDFLAIISGLKPATTRKEAEQFATTLRQFIARRDAAGALAWASRNKD